MPAKSMITNLTVERTDLLMVDPRTIQVADGFNCRDFSLSQNKEHIKDLRESIRVNGVQDPLWVRLVFVDGEKSLVLVDGESRLRAVQDLIEEGVDIKSVPCVEKKGDEQETFLLSMIGNTGKPLSKWEVGGAYQRFINWGWTAKQIAEKMGQSKKYVEEALELKDAPAPIKKLLSEAAVTPAHAQFTIRKYGDKSTLILETQVKQAKAAAEKKIKEKEAKKAAAVAEGRHKGGRPAKEKPVTVKREKTTGGKFLKTSLINVIIEALQSALISDDVDISMSAESALEQLQAALGNGE